MSPLTDEQIAELWYQSKEQPYRFARMIERLYRVTCPPCNENCNQGRDCPARKKL